MSRGGGRSDSGGLPLELAGDGAPGGGRSLEGGADRAPLSMHLGIRFDASELDAGQGERVAGFIGGEVIGHGLQSIVRYRPASASRIGDYCMAQTRQKKGKSAAVEGKRVAARVTEQERMEALWKEAKRLAREGKNGPALRVLERARRLAVKLQARERERWKWSGKKRG